MGVVSFPNRGALRRVATAVALLCLTMQLSSFASAEMPFIARNKAKGAVLRPYATFDLTPRDASVVSWAPDSRRVAAAGIFNDAVYVFDIIARRQVMVLKKDKPGSMALGWSPDGRYIAAGNWGTANVRDKTSVYIWNAATGARVKAITGPFVDAKGVNDPNSLAFSPNSKYLAVSYVGRTGREGEYIFIYDVESASLVRSFGNTRNNRTTSPLVFSRDGRYLIEGTSSGEIRLWNVVTGNIHKRFNAHAYDVTAVALSPNGRFVASSTSMGSTRGRLDKATGQFLRIKIVDAPKILNVANGGLVKSLDGYSARINGALAFSPDGQYLISGSDDKLIRVWTAGTWLLLDEVGISDRPTSLAISPDARYVALGAGRSLIISEIVRQRAQSGQR